MNSFSLTTKKSRAKSCTSCRQVKLRCDARDKFPAPCSRCEQSKQECKMDPNFKRVGTRRRLEPASELPNRGLSIQSTEKSIDSQSNFSDTLFSPNQPQDGISYGPSNHSPAQQSQPYIQITGPIESQFPEKWLNLDSQPLNQGFSPPWIIGNITVEHKVLQDLFQQFEDYYYPHMPILEPVQSFQTLCKDSLTLFWTIAFTACQHHPSHSHLYKKIREPYQYLLAGVLSRPILLLKDLQALLLICHWPLDVESQFEDPSWMYSGMAVNAALHMGLDKFEDEVLFGYRRAKHSLISSDSRYRRRTWMKCFQISTQLSSWHGVRPHLGSAPCLQKLTEFYDKSIAPGDFIAMTEIQRQVARYTTSLDESSSGGASVSLIYLFAHELDDIRTRFSTTWSASAEINLQGAKLYLFANCLVVADQQVLQSQTGSDAAVFLSTILQWGHAAAVRLISVMGELGASGIDNPPCSPPEAGGCPLLAHPKQHFRNTFFACIFLLKYLDCNRVASATDKDAARNAITTTYRLFMRFTSLPQIIRAAKTIEVLGRTIIPDQGRMVTHVKTRMGASLVYNAVWTAAKLRGRQNDPEFSTTAPAPPQPKHSLTPTDALDFMASANIAVVNSDTNSSLSPSPEQYFPWGIWDDALYDALGFGWDGSALSDLPGSMGNL